MGKPYTPGRTLTVLALAALAASAQPRPRLDWRRTGNSAQLLGLSSPAGGPVERVWFGAGRLLVKLPDGRVYGSADLETWQADSSAAPVAESPAPADARAPEAGATFRSARAGSATLYAVGRHGWRSEDGGLNWRNLTALGSESILGARLNDLAVDASDEQHVAAATSTGVWVSSDGGHSWLGLNDGLPNLPLRRILSAASGSRGVRIAVEQGAAILRELEWTPGQRFGWLETAQSALATENALKRTLSGTLAAHITAVAAQGDTLYAGASDGRLWASLDAGSSWRASAAAPSSGVVERIWLDGADRNFALAALSGPAGPRVLRTLNGGGYWDDLSMNLPAAPAYGIAADRSSGAVYVATAQGLFFTLADLRAPAQPTPWQSLSAGLPDAVLRDVRLDEAGNQILAAVDGYGVFVALAPHRARQPRVVHTFDYGLRAAAPGALLSVLGARVTSGTANASGLPVLNSTEAESQIQIPFDSSGDSLELVLNATEGRVVFGLPLEAVAPAILVDRDGTPMLIDAASGLQLDAMHPARPAMRVQVLMSGLGRVQPDWPTGLAAPLEDTPRVVAPLRAALDGAPLSITHATLAPGYIGYYLVEFQMPQFVDAGASELLIEASGRPANRVRVYVAQ